MAGETTLTVIGNLTADPELRFTPSGVAVASFTVASTPRTFDRQANEWRDGETLFMRCSVWREVAENVAESLTKGMRVIVRGRLESRSYKSREGENRTSLEMQVDEVGPSLRYAKAQVTRNPRDNAGAGAGARGGYSNSGYGNGGSGQNSYGQNYGGQGGQTYGGGQGGFPDSGTAGANQDPWATDGGGSTSFDDEPPF